MENVFKLVSWNIHKGKSASYRPADHYAAKELFESIHADALCLQEVEFSERCEPLTRVYGDEGFIYRANVVKKSRHHGNAVVCMESGGQQACFRNNWNVSAHRFERRSLLHVELSRCGHAVHIFSAHLALTPLAQRKQIRQFMEIQSQLGPDAKIIVAGDFNCPTNMLTKMMQAAGFVESPCCKRRTFPAAVPLMKLDKIYVKNLKPVAGGVLDKGNWAKHSDHLPVWATVALD